MRCVQQHCADRIAGLVHTAISGPFPALRKCDEHERAANGSIDMLCPAHATVQLAQLAGLVRLTLDPLLGNRKALVGFVGLQGLEGKGVQQP